MPSCYKCGRETPVTSFYLFRQYLNGGKVAQWWYACNIACLRLIVKEKAQDGWTFLVRKYLGNHGMSWRFGTVQELKSFVETKLG